MVLESAYHRIVESFGFDVCLRVILCSFVMFNTRKAAQCCKDFAYKLRAIVCIVKRKNTVPYDLLIEKDNCITRQCSLS